MIQPDDKNLFWRKLWEDDAMKITWGMIAFALSPLLVGLLAYLIR